MQTIRFYMLRRSIYSLNWLRNLHASPTSTFPPRHIGTSYPRSTRDSPRRGQLTCPSATSAPRLFNVALQGGGAHGAFTLGLLDKLLENGRMRFEGVSSTSAGAMNAVALAHGLLEDGARAALSRFWLAVASSSPLQPAGAVDGGGNGSLAAPVRAMLQWTSFHRSDHLNPLDINPLRHIVTAQIDFDRLRRCSPVKLFVAATHANTGKLRFFRTAELSANTVLASVCLISLQRTVEIDGEPYWDGGYAANPAVFHLFYECSVSEVLLILLAPVSHSQDAHDRAGDQAARGRPRI